MRRTASACTRSWTSPASLSWVCVIDVSHDGEGYTPVDEGEERKTRGQAGGLDLEMYTFFRLCLVLGPGKR